MIDVQFPWAGLAVLTCILDLFTRGVASPDPRLVAIRKGLTKAVTECNAWDPVALQWQSGLSFSLSHEDLALLVQTFEQCSSAQLDGVLDDAGWLLPSDFTNLKNLFDDAIRQSITRAVEIEEARANGDLSPAQDDALSEEYDSLLHLFQGWPSARAHFSNDFKHPPCVYPAHGTTTPGETEKSSCNS